MAHGCWAGTRSGSSMSLPDIGRNPDPRFVWTVAALVHAVADALASRFSVCTVRGELSGFARAASGHCYFSLKDADGGDAMVRCAMFRRAASLLNFNPADGQQVEIRGRLAVYEPRGELQFIVESMQRGGDGALLEQFLRLKAKLQAQGLFDAERKRALPAFPLCVGVVTSLGGAALHDVASAFARRAPHVRLVVYPSLVQGAQAPAALVQVLATAGQRAEVDLLIVCRGGGSLEDLWAFNDEAVVRAVAACPVPVISGVGHETDVTLVDFCADLRAPTPTAAAELAAPATADMAAGLDALAAQLLRGLQAQVDRRSQRLDRLALQLARPADALRQAGARLGLVAQRLAAAQRRRMERSAHVLQQAEIRMRHARRALLDGHRHRLESLATRLSAIDPRQVLGRGYAWLADEGGVPVVSAQAVRAGQALDAVWADGRARVRVERVEADRTGDAPPRQP